MEKPEGTGVEYQRTEFIDGEQYKLHIFMPSKAFKLAARLAKFLGEPIVAMASAAGDESKAGDALATATRALMTNLHEDGVWALATDLMACVTHDGKSIAIDNHFKGRLGHLLNVLIQVVEFQFKDFSEAIGQAIAKASEKKAA